MQQKLRLNPHGVAGILSIVLMFGIAFFLNWNVNWWYFVIAVVLYSCAVIFLSTQKENYTPTYGGVISNYEWLISRCLFGCHLALLFLAVGLLLHFPGYITGLGGFPGLYFLASVVGGFAIPFMLLGISKDLQKMSIHLHGLIALLLIILLFGIAFFYSWSFDWVYWVYFIAAIMLYAGMFILLNPFRTFSDPLSLSAPPFQRYLPSEMKVLLGCHLAFIFLIVGFGLHFKDRGSIIGFFIASIVIGLAIAHLLFRGSSGSPPSETKTHEPHEPAVE